MEEGVPFVRPHFYALLLAPLSWLPYPTAFGLWIFSQAALLVGCWVWGRRRLGPDSLIFSALYFPPIAGIFNGQDCVFLAVIAIAAYTWAEKGRDLQSGLILGLALFKFHLVVFVPLAMLLQRRPKMLLGFAITGATEVLLSLLLGGRVGIEKYIALLTNTDLSRLSPVPQKMLNVYAIGANFGIDHLAVKIAGALLVAALVVVAVRSGPLWRWMAAAMAGSILAVPHVYAYDATILLPFLLLTIIRSKDPYSRILATTYSVPLPFVAFSIGVPWGFVPALVLLCLLAALARESYMEGRANNPAETGGLASPEKAESLG